MTISHVRATTFLHQLQAGSSGPAVFSCSTETESGLDYVVKFRGNLGHRIISEYIASAVGQRLALPLPSLAVVEIDQAMAEFVSNAEVRTAIMADPGPHIGTVYMTGGFSIFNEETFLPPALSATIASIFTFDMMTQNYDRVNPSDGNPNLLVRGDDLAVLEVFA